MSNIVPSRVWLNQTYVQGLKTTGVLANMIGISATDKVTIDPDGIGTRFGSNVGIGIDPTTARLRVDNGATTDDVALWSANGLETLKADYTGMLSLTGISASSLVRIGRHLPGDINQGVHSQIDAGTWRMAYTTGLDRSGGATNRHFFLWSDGSAPSRLNGPVGIEADPDLIDGGGPEFAGLTIGGRTGQGRSYPKVWAGQAWGWIAKAGTINTSSFWKIADSEAGAAESFLLFSSGNPTDTIARIGIRDGAGYKLQIGKCNELGAGFVPLFTVDEGAGVSGIFAPRVTTVADTGAITFDGDTTDVYVVTALNQNLTFNNPIGTIPDQKQIVFQIIDGGGFPFALTFDTAFLPTVTYPLPVANNAGLLSLTFTYIASISAFVLTFSVV